MGVWQNFLISMFDTKESHGSVSSQIEQVLAECSKQFPGFKVSFWVINTRKNEIKAYKIISGSLVQSNRALSQFRFEHTLRSKNKPFYLFQNVRQNRVLIPLFVDGNLSGCVAVSSARSKSYEVWRRRLPYFFLVGKRLLKFLALNTKNQAIDTLMELNQKLKKEVGEKALFLEQEQQAHWQTSKMATLGQVAVEIAHEINNPLTIIVARIASLEKSMEKKGILNSEFSESMVKINETIERIVKIVNGLRHFSHTGGDKKTGVVMSRIISDSLDLCHDRLKKSGTALKILKPVFDIEVLGHDTQLVQVLLNLIINSLDAVSEQKDQSDKWIQIEYKIQKDNLNIIVRDSGQGLRAEVVDKIMNPFYTTKEKGRGTGLGLSLSKTIIENHGGKLFYNLGTKNTEFIIELPYTRIIDS